MAASAKSHAPKAVASLPMYDWPEVSPVVDRLWEGVAAHLREAKMPVPAQLARRTDHTSVWREPGLVLSQTCGYPYVKSLRGKVTLVGAPVYDVPGCDGATYCSFLIVRRTDPVASIAALRGRRAAINGWDSQSGFSALRATVAPFTGGGRFFGEVKVSGGHRASLHAVADGIADVAAIDAVCWALAQRHEPAAYAGLRVLAQSPTAPSLPFITSAAGDPLRHIALLYALRQTLAAGGPLFRNALFLADVLPVNDAAYDRITEIERRAAQLGYATVA